MNSHAPQPFTVAAVQMRMRREHSVEEFNSHVVAIVREAAARGAELVLLPELSTIGMLATHPRVDDLRADDLREAWRAVFPGLTDELVAAFSSIAMRHGVWLVGGTHWRQAEDGSYRNTAYLAHPDGRVETQDKLHLTSSEEAIGTTAGSEVSLFDMRGVKVAIQPGADVEFAEVTRALVDAGTDIVLCPSIAWDSRGASRIRASCLARSVEQQVFVVQSPMIGTSGIPGGSATSAMGHARITAPIDATFRRPDGLAAQATSTTEEVIVATLDIEKVRRTRLDSDSIGTRHARPQLYSTLAEQLTTAASQERGRRPARTSPHTYEIGAPESCRLTTMASPTYT